MSRLFLSRKFERANAMPGATAGKTFSITLYGSVQEERGAQAERLRRLHLDRHGAAAYFWMIRTRRDCLRFAYGLLSVPPH
jgi:hypothetical protein